jgi:hypothetical protein
MTMAGELQIGLIDVPSGSTPAHPADQLINDRSRDHRFLDKGTLVNRVRALGMSGHSGLAVAEVGFEFSGGFLEWWQQFAFDRL